MPAISQTGDLSKQYVGYERQSTPFRANPGDVFAPGACVKLLSKDKQLWPDAKTVGLTGTGAAQQLILGVVSDASSSQTGASSAVRGTQAIDVITVGYHSALLVDQAGTAAAAITNETPLVPSRATAGRMQGVATAVGALGTAAIAHLPASGLCSNLTAAAITQASQTVTIAGTPAAGDTVTVTLQIPYTEANPGVVQTRAVSIVVGSSPTATSVAAQVVTAITGDAVLKLYYTATNSLGVVTVTSIGNAATSAPFLVTFAGSYGGQTVVAEEFTFNFGGSAANGATISSSAVGATTATAGGASLAGGAGYYGTLPGFVV